MTEMIMKLRDLLSPVKNQRGVALMTVIFVAAALMVVSSTAAFVTVREFRAGSDDRKATEALAYAEAGVDRMIQHIRSSGTVTFGELRKAGCEPGTELSLPTTTIGSGTFSVTAWLYDPSGDTPVDKIATEHPRNKGTSTPSSYACDQAALAGNKRTSYLAIESVGEHPAAKRVVQQVVEVSPRGLPIGIVADEINANGTAQTIGVSMISAQTIVGREKIVFQGTDPYYTMGDFWPGGPFPPGISESTPIPSAAHAVGGIYMKANGSEWQFSGGPKNCAANANGQSLWDGDGSGTESPDHGPITSGCAGQTGYPPDSYFSAEDYANVVKRKLDAADHKALKQAAKSFGIYCSIVGNSQTCTKQGVSFPHSGNFQDGDLSSLFAGGVLNFVVYIEFPSGLPANNEVSWKANVWGCNDDPAISRSAVIVVRNGGLELESGADINGALLLDGEFKYRGNVVFNGTIMASKFNIRGDSTFSLDECWVKNMPGPFLGVTPTHWSELDR